MYLAYFMGIRQQKKFFKKKYQKVLSLGESDRYCK